MKKKSSQSKKAVKKIKKKLAKKPVLAAPKMGKPIGKVTHYFSNIKVGVIKLSAPLSVGSEIRIVGGEATDFNQTVVSLQVDHQPVKTAKKGSSVGLKVKKQVREGYRVYKG